jgi:hypothetical protein
MRCAACKNKNAFGHKGHPSTSLREGSGRRRKTGSHDEHAAHIPAFRMSAASASIARWLAWVEASGKAPKIFTRSSLFKADASARVLPSKSSARAEPQAIAGTQPFTRNFISTMCPCKIRAVNFKMSPQTGFSTWATASGESTVPGLRGRSKWSRTWGEYTEDILGERQNL